MAPVIGDVLWTPAGGRAPDDRDRALPELAARRARPRLRGLRRAVALVGRATSRASGASSGTSSTCARTRPTSACWAKRAMPGAEWFPGARAELRRALLGTRRGRRPRRGGRALADARADRADLRRAARPGRAGPARACSALGVGAGDRVVAYLPNIPETLVAFIATASLGAIWAACAPEFGARSVVDRFAQIEPKVLLAVAGYTLPRPRRSTAASEVAEIRAGAARRSSTSSTSPTATNELPDAVGWEDAAAPTPAPLEFEPGRLRPPAVRAVLVGHDRAAQGDRARPRRPADRAPQELGPGLGPQARRAPAVVLHHRVDDVERARVGAARARRRS